MRYLVPFILSFNCLAYTVLPIDLPEIPVKYKLTGPSKFRKACVDAMSEITWSTYGLIRFEEAGKEDTTGITFTYSRKGWVDSDKELAYAYFPVFNPPRYYVAIVINAHNYKWHRGAPFYTSLDPPGRFIGDVSLDVVLIHEILHALGLGHSSDPDSSTYPGRSSYLGVDDLLALEELYRMFKT